MLLTRKLLVDCKRFHDSDYKKVEMANQELEISLLKEKGSMEEVDENGKERFVPQGICPQTISESSTHSPCLPSH